MRLFFKSLYVIMGWVCLFSLALAGCKSYQNIARKTIPVSKDLLCNKMTLKKDFKIHFRKDSVVYIYIQAVDSNKLYGIARLNKRPSRKETTITFEKPSALKTTFYTESFETLASQQKPVKVYEYKVDNPATIIAICLPLGIMVYFLSWDYDPDFYD